MFGLCVIIDADLLRQEDYDKHFLVVGTHEFFVCHMVCIIYMGQAVVHECQQKFYKSGYVLVLVCSSLQTCH